MECAAAAGTGPLIDIDGLLDTLEVGWQRAAVGLARPVGGGPACLVAGMLGLRQCSLDLFETKLELVRIELLRAATEPVALQGLDDRLEALDLGLENLENVELLGLLQDERAERIDVVWEVRFHEHDSSESALQSPVNRQSAARSAGVRHARGASPGPPAAHRAGRRSRASRRPGCLAT